MWQRARFIYHDEREETYIGMELFVKGPPTVQRYIDRFGFRGEGIAYQTNIDLQDGKMCWVNAEHVELLGSKEEDFSESEPPKIKLRPIKGASLEWANLS